MCDSPECVVLYLCVVVQQEQCVSVCVVLCVGSTVCGMIVEGLDLG